ncbi:hypothetical protein GGS20DRAFT_479987 [Poronia punctata]|nr:hypothetical protein GGS20DRAFT_479987 [Poronia punctata]
MLDPYEELETLRKGRLASYTGMREVSNTKDTCKREHGKNHPVECLECWTVLIDHLRDRYLNSAIKEWFSGRRAFLQELDDLFAKARQREVDFKTIEQRIADEKKEWFRDKVRNLGLQLAAKSPTEARVIQQKVNDREISPDQLLSEIGECLGMDKKMYDALYESFLEQVKPNQTPTGRSQAYIDALFQPLRDPANAAKAQKYIDMIANGKHVGEVIAAMARDRQSSKGDAEQKQRLQKKLEELRRAKAAHELAKMKRDQARQAKAREAAAQNKNNNDLPPCSVCDKAVDPHTFIACSLCQILAEGYKMQPKPTLFCSETCRDEGHESHVSESHGCWSGADCISLVESDPMDMDEPTLVFCHMCVDDLGRASIFCSSRCFGVNFRQHRDLLHSSGIKDDEMTEEGQIRSDAEDDEMDTDMKPEEHIITLRDAITDWQKKTGARVT